MSSLIEKQGKYYKEVEVVMLETKEKTKLWLDNFGSGLYYTNSTATGILYQHLYFLSGEEIKEGDWCIHNGIVKQAFEEVIPFANKYAKKIIATTDSSLIIEGNCWCMKPQRGGCYECNKSLPQPSPEFIKAFIEAYNSGKPITKVFVEYEKVCSRCYSNNTNECWSAKECSDGKYDLTRLKIKDNQIICKKVEEKMYSKSEVIELMQKAITYGTHLEAGAIKVNYKIDYKLEWIKQNLK